MKAIAIAAGVAIYGAAALVLAVAGVGVYLWRHAERGPPLDPERLRRLW